MIRYRHPAAATIVLTVVLLFSPAMSLFADLGDFGEAVEEENEKAEEESPDNQEVPVEDVDDTEENDGFLGFLFDITLMLWIYHNSTTWYTEYPYASGNLRPAMIGHEAETQRKRNFAVLTVSAGGFEEGGSPGWSVATRAVARVQSLVSAEFEYRLWSDSSGDLHLLRAGGAVPLIQDDWISVDFTMAGAFFFDAFRLDGFAVGGTVTSYPVRPLSIEIRGGAILSSGADLGEAGVRAAIHLKRFALFAGYSGLYVADRAIHVLEFGGGVHF